MTDFHETLPSQITSEAALEEILTRPSHRLCEAISQWKSPLVVLGAAGKMGPSLCKLAKRAAEEVGHNLDVIAVSRFSDELARKELEAAGITTHKADLLDPDQVACLPQTNNLVYLVGMKFGTSSNPELTWAVNTIPPLNVMSRYKGSRIVVLSTGNVYPLVSVTGPGSRETDPLTPLGEYANAAVARERLFQFCAGRDGTKVCLVRLSYAIDLRYGVIPDLVRAVWEERPIPLGTSQFNAIWQGDANEMILRSLSLVDSPAFAVNLTSPQRLSVRETAERLGSLLGKSPRFEGTESGTAFLSDTIRLEKKLGQPLVSMDQLIAWSAEWVKSGGRSLGKPTHFETRDGVY